MREKKEKESGDDKKKDAFFLFLKGLVMGVSDIIPGVSGGTMALITGIYERLVNAINKIRLLDPFRTFDFRFFIPLLIGIGSAVILMSNIIHAALENFKGVTYSFFFGLILASAVFIFRHHLRKINLTVVIAGIIGFVFSFIFVDVNPLQSSHSLIVLFLSGVVAISAMLLPGISGAFILLFLGQYKYLLDVIKSIQIKEIVVFGLGAVLGVFIFSKIIGYLLEHKKSATMSFLIGLMLGSLRFPYKEIVDVNVSIVLTILFGILGIGVVVGLEMLSGKEVKH